MYNYEDYKKDYGDLTDEIGEAIQHGRERKIRQKAFRKAILWNIVVVGLIIILSFLFTYAE